MSKHSDDINSMIEDSVMSATEYNRVLKRRYIIKERIRSRITEGWLFFIFLLSVPSIIVVVLKALFY